MKQLNETFTDREFEKLKKAKGQKTWRQWMLQAAHKQPNNHTQTTKHQPCPGIPSDKTRLKTAEKPPQTQKEVNGNEPHKHENIRHKTENKENTTT